MTRDEIQLPFLGDCPVNFGAMSFAVPTLAWLRGPFYDAFRARYWAENLDKWKRRWECRDFASAYRLTALECWAEMPDTPETDDGLAIGEIWFRPDPAQPLAGHAICPIVTEHGLQFIDPQNNQLWTMTDAQFASRYFVRF